MIKDFSRDYVLNAFRMWAANGCKPYEEIAAEIREDKLFSERFGSPERALLLSEKEVEKRRAELWDLFACGATFRVLEQKGKEEIISAVRSIYMAHPNKGIKRNEITERARSFSLEHYVSERTIYRWLKAARLLFCRFRGINCGGFGGKEE